MQPILILDSRKIKIVLLLLKVKKVQFLTLKMQLSLKSQEFFQKKRKLKLSIMSLCNGPKISTQSVSSKSIPTTARMVTSSLKNHLRNIL